MSARKHVQKSECLKVQASHAVRDTQDFAAAFAALKQNPLGEFSELYGLSPNIARFQALPSLS